MEQNISLALLACAGGCAAKISRTEVRAASSRLPGTGGGRVIVGHSTGDDATLVTLTDKPALVETLDIFPPIAAAPYDHGGIATADAPGDIHAMAAQPTGALSFVAWPADHPGPVRWVGCRSPIASNRCPRTGFVPGARGVVVTLLRHVQVLRPRFDELQQLSVADAQTSGGLPMRVDQTKPERRRAGPGDRRPLPRSAESWRLRRRDTSGWHAIDG